MLDFVQKQFEYNLIECENTFNGWLYFKWVQKTSELFLKQKKKKHMQIHIGEDFDNW